MTRVVSFEAKARIQEKRASIVEIDDRLVGLISARLELAREIGRLKQDAGMPTVDPQREAEVVRHAASLARTAGMDEEPIRQVFWALIGLCRRGQDEPE